MARECSMITEESVTRIEDLQNENLELQSKLDDARWRVVDIWMIGIACFVLGFLCHDCFILTFRWLCSCFQYE